VRELLFALQQLLRRQHKVAEGVAEDFPAAQRALQLALGRVLADGGYRLPTTVRIVQENRRSPFCWEVWLRRA